MAGLGIGAPIVQVYHEKSFILPDVSRVLACLYEKDVKFETHTASYKSLLRLQASSHAPVPFYDGPTFLEESRGICRYIAEKYEHQGYPFLLGKDALERASIEQWLHNEEHAFDPPSRALFCHLAFPLGEEEDDDIDIHTRKLEEVLEVYEQRLSDSEFLVGNKFTLADLVHLPNSHYIKASNKFLYLYDSRKNVRRWWDAISDRDSWKKVLSYMKWVEEQNKQELKKQQQQQDPRISADSSRLDPRKQIRTEPRTILVPPTDIRSSSSIVPRTKKRLPGYTSPDELLISSSHSTPADKTSAVQSKETTIFTNPQETGLNDLKHDDADHLVSTQQGKPRKDVQQYPSQDSEQATSHSVPQEPMSQDVLSQLDDYASSDQRGALLPPSTQEHGVTPSRQAAAKDASRIISSQAAYPGGQDTSKQPRDHGSVPRQGEPQDARKIFDDSQAPGSTISSARFPYTSQSSLPRHDLDGARHATAPFETRYPGAEDTPKQAKDKISTPWQMTDNDSGDVNEETKVSKSSSFQAQPSYFERADAPSQKQETIDDTFKETRYHSVAPPSKTRYQTPPSKARYPTAEDTSKQPRGTAPTPKKKAAQDDNDTAEKSKTAWRSPVSPRRQKDEDSSRSDTSFQKRYPYDEEDIQVANTASVPWQIAPDGDKNIFEETKLPDSTPTSAKPVYTPQTPFPPPRQAEVKDASDQGRQSRVTIPESHKMVSGDAQTTHGERKASTPGEQSSDRLQVIPQSRPPAAKGLSTKEEITNEQTVVPPLLSNEPTSRAQPASESLQQVASRGGLSTKPSTIEQWQRATAPLNDISSSSVDGEIGAETPSVQSAPPSFPGASTARHATSDDKMLPTPYSAPAHTKRETPDGHEIVDSELVSTPDRHISEAAKLRQDQATVHEDVHDANLSAHDVAKDTFKEAKIAESTPSSAKTMYSQQPAPTPRHAEVQDTWDKGMKGREPVPDRQQMLEQWAGTAREQVSDRRKASAPSRQTAAEDVRGATGDTIQSPDVLDTSKKSKGAYEEAKGPGSVKEEKTSIYQKPLDSQVQAQTIPAGEKADGSIWKYQQASDAPNTFVEKINASEPARVKTHGDFSAEQPYRKDTTDDQKVAPPLSTRELTSHVQPPSEPSYDAALHRDLSSEPSTIYQWQRSSAPLHDVTSSSGDDEVAKSTVDEKPTPVSQQNPDEQRVEPPIPIEAEISGVQHASPSFPGASVDDRATIGDKFAKRSIIDERVGEPTQTQTSSQDAHPSSEPTKRETKAADSIPSSAQSMHIQQPALTPSRQRQVENARDKSMQSRETIPEQQKMVERKTGISGEQLSDRQKEIRPSRQPSAEDATIQSPDIFDTPKKSRATFEESIGPGSTLPKPQVLDAHDSQLMKGESTVPTTDQRKDWKYAKDDESIMTEENSLSTKRLREMFQESASTAAKTQHADSEGSNALEKTSSVYEEAQAIPADEVDGSTSEHHESFGDPYTEDKKLSVSAPSRADIHDDHRAEEKYKKYTADDQKVAPSLSSKEPASQVQPASEPLQRAVPDGDLPTKSFTIDQWQRTAAPLHDVITDSGDDGEAMSSNNDQKSRSMSQEATPSSQSVNQMGKQSGEQSVEPPVPIVAETSDVGRAALSLPEAASDKFTEQSNIEERMGKPKQMQAPITAAHPASARTMRTPDSHEAGELFHTPEGQRLEAAKPTRDQQAPRPASIQAQTQPPAATLDVSPYASSKAKSTGQGAKPPTGYQASSPETQLGSAQTQGKAAPAEQKFVVSDEKPAIASKSFASAEPREEDTDAATADQTSGPPTNVTRQVTGSTPDASGALSRDQEPPDDSQMRNLGRPLIASQEEASRAGRASEGSTPKVDSPVVDEKRTLPSSQAQTSSTLPESAQIGGDARLSGAGMPATSSMEKQEAEPPVATQAPTSKGLQDTGNIESPRQASTDQPMEPAIKSAAPSDAPEGPKSSRSVQALFSTEPTKQDTIVTGADRAEDTQTITLRQATTAPPDIAKPPFPGAQDASRKFQESTDDDGPEEDYSPKPSAQTQPPAATLDVSPYASSKAKSTGQGAKPPTGYQASSLETQLGSSQTQGKAAPAEQKFVVSDEKPAIASKSFASTDPREEDTDAATADQTSVPPTNITRQVTGSTPDASGALSRDQEPSPDDSQMRNLGRPLIASQEEASHAGRASEGSTPKVDSPIVDEKRTLPSGQAQTSSTLPESAQIGGDARLSGAGMPAISSMEKQEAEPPVATQAPNSKGLQDSGNIESPRQASTDQTMTPAIKSAAPSDAPEGTEPGRNSSRSVQTPFSTEPTKEDTIVSEDTKTITFQQAITAAPDEAKSPFPGAQDESRKFLESTPNDGPVEDYSPKPAAQTQPPAATLDVSPYASSKPKSTGQGAKPPTGYQPSSPETQLGSSQTQGKVAPAEQKFVVSDEKPAIASKSFASAEPREEDTDAATADQTSVPPTNITRQVTGSTPDASGALSRDQEPSPDDSQMRNLGRPLIASQEEVSRAGRASEGSTPKVDSPIIDEKRTLPSRQAQTSSTLPESTQIGGDARLSGAGIPATSSMEKQEAEPDVATQAPTSKGLQDSGNIESPRQASTDQTMTPAMKSAAPSDALEGTEPGPNSSRSVQTHFSTEPTKEETIVSEDTKTITLQQAISAAPDEAKSPFPGAQDESRKFLESTPNGGPVEDYSPKPAAQTQPPAATLDVSPYASSKAESTGQGAKPPTGYQASSPETQLGSSQTQGKVAPAEQKFVVSDEKPAIASKSFASAEPREEDTDAATADQTSVPPTNVTRQVTGLTPDASGALSRDQEPSPEDSLMRNLGRPLIASQEEVSRAGRASEGSTPKVDSPIVDEKRTLPSSQAQTSSTLPESAQIGGDARLSGAGMPATSSMEKQETEPPVATQAPTSKGLQDSGNIESPRQASTDQTMTPAIKSAAPSDAPEGTEPGLNSSRSVQTPFSTEPTKEDTIVSEDNQTITLQQAITAAPDEAKSPFPGAQDESRKFQQSTPDDGSEEDYSPKPAAQTQPPAGTLDVSPYASSKAKSTGQGVKPPTWYQASSPETQLGSSQTEGKAAPAEQKFVVSDEKPAIASKSFASAEPREEDTDAATADQTSGPPTNVTRQVTGSTPDASGALSRDQEPSPDDSKMRNLGHPLIASQEEVSRARRASEGSTPKVDSPIVDEKRTLPSSQAQTSSTLPESAQIGGDGRLSGAGMPATSSMEKQEAEPPVATQAPTSKGLQDSGNIESARQASTDQTMILAIKSAAPSDAPEGPNSSQSVLTPFSTGPTKEGTIVTAADQGEDMQTITDQQAITPSLDTAKPSFPGANIESRKFQENTPDDGHIDEPPRGNSSGPREGQTFGPYRTNVDEMTTTFPSRQANISESGSDLVRIVGDIVPSIGEGQAENYSPKPGAQTQLPAATQDVPFDASRKAKSTGQAAKAPTGYLASTPDTQPGSSQTQGKAAPAEEKLPVSGMHSVQPSKGASFDVLSNDKTTMTQDQVNTLPNGDLSSNQVVEQSESVDSKGVNSGRNLEGASTNEESKLQQQVDQFGTQSFEDNNNKEADGTVRSNISRASEELQEPALRPKGETSEEPENQQLADQAIVKPLEGNEKQAEQTKPHETGTAELENVEDSENTNLKNNRISQVETLDQSGKQASVFQQPRKNMKDAPNSTEDAPIDGKAVSKSEHSSRSSEESKVQLQSEDNTQGRVTDAPSLETGHPSNRGLPASSYQNNSSQSQAEASNKSIEQSSPGFQNKDNDSSRLDDSTDPSKPET